MNAKWTAVFLVGACHPQTAAPVNERVFTAPSATESPTITAVAAVDPCAIDRATVDRDEDAPAAFERATLDCRLEHAKLVARGLGPMHPSLLLLEARAKALDTARASFARSGGGAVAYRQARLREREGCLIASGKGDNHPSVVAVRTEIAIVAKQLKEPRVVRRAPVPEGFTMVAPFASTAFAKASTFYRHAYGNPRACVPVRYEQGRITETADDPFADLASSSSSPSPALKLVSHSKVILETGTFSQGPFTFRLELVDSGYVDARGKHVDPPGRGEGIALCGPPSFTVLAEDASGLLVMDDEPLPFIAYDPRATERWYATEPACTSDPHPLALHGCE